MDHVEQFRSVIEAAGLRAPDDVVDDGDLHRFPTNGRASDDSGWYVLHGDGIPAGAFGDWRTGISETWRADVGRELTQEELRTHRERVAAIRRTRQEQEALEHEAAAVRAQKAWDSARPVTAHPYLERKRVGPLGVRVDESGALLIPMRGSNGALHSLQFISADGEKRFLAGGKVSGCYHSAGVPEGAICVAEGYATAASIREATGHAVAVAFSAGNLTAVAKELRAKLPDVEIVIAGDNDESGVGQAKAAEAARAAGGSVAIPSGAGTDWNDVHRELGAEAVREGIEAAKVVRQDNTATGRILQRLDTANGRDSQDSQLSQEPEPLRRPTPPAKRYPIDALGPILGPAARRICEVVRAPDALCGQSILAAASLAVQPHADVWVDGRREPLSLWAVSIAESGERKSAVDAIALEPHKAFERGALTGYKLERTNFDAELAAYEAASRHASKGKDQEVIAAAIKRLGGPPEPPLKPLLLVGTPTVEGLHKLYRDGLPTLGLFHDDAGEFLGGHAMNQENRTKSAAGLSKLWDSGEFDRIRAGDGAEKFFGRRLAMHLMMQPVIAETVLSDDVLTGQGFLARSLLAWPTSTIGTRGYVEVDLSSDPLLGRYRRVISDLLSRRLPLEPETRNELNPRPLALSPPAKERWIAVHNAIEADMRDGGDFASVRAWASKAPAQVLRIAGVLTLVEDVDAGSIEVDTIERAAKLMLFSLGEAVRIVGTAAVPTEIRHAEALLAWCRCERIGLLHSGAALQFGPGAIRTKRAFDAAVAELERCGWARPIEGGCEVEGKHRRRVWAVRQ